MGELLNIPPVLVPMLRVGMQGVALRSDIPRRSLPGKSPSPNLWIRPYMKYDEYIAKGCPTGSGVVESVCSHVVSDRMELSGARWSVNGAESVLRLRSVAKSKDWEDYW
ncbi:MAG: hypothetical protein GY749_31410, partial [Desulfobacteraceae bacterium]|nr:hypothetical protein [Desulfobacteraceae bacterium]